MNYNKFKLFIAGSILMSAALYNTNSVEAANVLSSSLPKETTTKTGQTRSSSINNYILQKNYQHPAIVSELHEFEMFNYSTPDKKPKGVVVHYTANDYNYSARSEADYEINGGWTSAFVHTFIDAGTILNIHDTDYGAWGSGPMGNQSYVQFEMVTARNYEDFAKTTSYSAWYTAYLLNKYNLTPSMAQKNGSGTVWSHSNVTYFLGGTDHTDPDAYFAKYGYNMNQFFELVQYYYNKMDTNKGWLDTSSATTNNLFVSGWHVSSQAKNKLYSFLFVMDADTNKELKRIQITRTIRNDVQSVYPNVEKSANSGFMTNIPVDQSMLGKNVKIMSRYSSDSHGNYDAVDYEYSNVIKMPSTRAASLDTVSYQNGKMNVHGWYADNNAVGKNNRFFIILDASNSKEIARYPITTLNRPDVANAYPGITGAATSGFEVNVPMTKELANKNVKFVVRYSNDIYGNGQTADQFFDYKIKDTSNRAWLDSFKNVGTDKLYAHGWHASDLTSDKPYSFIFVVDATNNQELGRYAINRINNRIDVQKAYPELYNGSGSGFDVTIPFTANMKGKYLKLMSRYTDDPNGNGNSVDYWFPQNTIKAN